MGKTCTDEVTNYLKKYGYTALRLPRAGVLPLDMRVAPNGKDVQDWGRLSDLPGFGPCPPVSSDVEVAAVVGKWTTDMKASLGLEILSGVISALSGVSVNLTSQFSSVRTVAFMFNEAKEQSVSPVLLESFLSGRDIDATDNSQTLAYIRENKLYIINSILKSSDFMVNFDGSNSTDLSTEVNALKDLVGAKIDVNYSSSAKSQVSFRASNPEDRLVFGCQLARLSFSKVNGANVLTIKAASATDHMAMTSTDGEFQVASLSAGEFITEMPDLGHGALALGVTSPEDNASA